MITLRVRRAASRSIEPRSSSVGRMSSRSAPSFSQVARTPTIEQTGAEQRHRRVLGGANRDAPTELGAALNPQMLRPGAAHGNERGVERLGNSGYHLQAEVLVSGFDAVHSALTGPQHVGKLGLGEPPMFTGVADQAPDPVQVRIRHGSGQYVICEIFGQLCVFCRRVAVKRTRRAGCWHDLVGYS